ncbi:MAG: PAS domain-containing sensor histidine kinase [Chloroflexi bacterium]|nr:PAS domain-containing sensor histidine kinase [Chloroflexota bacterium]MCI0644127.1 PAS domain-containing sensor histidine kinase [Chloroflexota bacterium]
MLPSPGFYALFSSLRHSQTEDKEPPYQRIFEAISEGLIVHDAATWLVVEANPAAAAMHGYAREEFIGLHPTTFTHPGSHHLLVEYIQAVQAGGRFEAVAVHVRRDGSPFSVEVRGTAFTYQHRPCLLSVIRDVSERVRAEQQLQQQVAAQMREQATLLTISQTLASALELQPGLILDQIGVIIEYTHAALFALEGLTLVALAVRGPQRLEEAMPFRIQLDEPATLAALLNGHRPQRIANVWSADPAAHFLRSLLNRQAAVLLEGVRAWMWVPLAVAGRVVGAVVVAHAEPDSFTAHHADLALTMANQAAITLVNAQLYEQAQTLATLQERQRLAQNLHDAVNQSLFSAGLIAEVLPRLWEQNPAEGRRSLEDLRRLTRGALAEMRGLLAELRPQVLIDSELGDLLRQLGNAFTGRTNIPVAVTVVGAGALPADVQVAFYRLCQEAFNNIAKHARASQVAIQLEYDAGAVELHIRDDGRGFDPEQIPSGHYGLSMMRERAEAVGARLIVTSRPAHGTEIAIHWTATGEQKAL